MKNRFVALFTVAALTLSLCACGGNTPSGASASPADPGQTLSEQTENTDDATAEDTTGTSEENTDSEPSADTAKEDTAADATGSGDTTGEDASASSATDSDLPEGIVAVKLPPAVPIPDNEAMTFVRDMKVGWNLGNTFDASNCNWLSDPLDYESAWCGTKTTKELILELKNAGFNSIRVPVSWHNHIDADHNIDKAWLDRVQEVVDYVYEEGMYVILNIHHDDDPVYMYPSYDCTDSSKKYLTDIWTQLAERFADYDTHLIFETMNEPRQVGTDIEWWVPDVNADNAKEAFDCINQMNQAAVDAIRSVSKGYNTERYIMVPGYCASPEFALIDAFQMPEDSLATAENRLILSVHAYTPYNFALNLSGTSEFDISKTSSTQDIDSFMRRLYTKYVSKGLPVVIGEFGALDKDKNTESRVQYAAYYIAMARHFGLTAHWWDNNALNADGECFQIIDRKTLTWSFPEIRDQLIYYSVER